MKDLLSHLKSEENKDEFSLWELVWNVFEKADPEAKTAITTHPSTFTRVFKEESKKKGVKWDNLCFAHEWWVDVEGRAEYTTH